MAEQLAPNLDIGNDGGINKPQEASLHPRSILGDNLPANQTKQAQPLRNVTPTTIAASQAVVLENQPANDDGGTDDRNIQRIFLKLLFGGSSFSIQAEMLKKRRLRAKKHTRKTAEQIMHEGAFKILGNPDQVTTSIKKAA